MSHLYDSIIRRLAKRFLSPRRWIRSRVQLSNPRLVRLGTEYGGWTVLADGDLFGHYAILCGAGEDISFDIALSERFGCEVIIVDPTPRAVSYFERMKQQVRAAQASKSS